MERIWGQFNDNTAVLLTLFVILMSGFLITRLTNVLRMPRVSGYIIAGIVIGPCVLHLVPGGIVDRMGFVSDIALAFIAFGVGKFFKKDALRRTGREIVWITVSEALAAGALVTLVLHFLFGLSWDFSLILGAIATATAPAQHHDDHRPVQGQGRNGADAPSDSGSGRCSLPSDFQCRLSLGIRPR